MQPWIQQVIGLRKYQNMVSRARALAESFDRDCQTSQDNAICPPQHDPVGGECRAIHDHKTARFLEVFPASAALAPLKLEPAPASDVPLIRAHMPELDSLRGIAILLVVLFHGMAPPVHTELQPSGRWLLTLSQYGWVGVNLFFVLSGFLITGILLASRQGADYFRRFYFRRALRILPALYGTLLVLLIGGWISFRFMAISVLFLANFAWVMGVRGGYPILWSLAVEEHFYLLWPLAVRRCSLRKLMILAAAVCLGSPLLRILTLLGRTTPPHIVSLCTWFSLDGLCLGALLRIWLGMPSFRRHQLARIAPPVTVVSGAAFLFLTGHRWADATVVKSACNLASAGLLSCMLLLGTSSWRFLVDRPILKFYGFISYGLYLVHIFAFYVSDMVFSNHLSILIDNGKPMLATLLRFASGLLLGTAIAYLSRRSLEERFLRIGCSLGRAPVPSVFSARGGASVDSPIATNS
ncbi:MAG TPA: acyltransferase [Terriglobales bacterium]|nr:acyltransferase [Terriglobales bacterium]